MFKPKIWLRLGALAVAGSATVSSKPIHATEAVDPSKAVVGQYDSSGTVVAQRGTRGAGAEGGVPLRPRLLHKSNKNPESSKGRERAAKAENEDTAENEDKAESKASTRATSSDLPRARIPREQARRNLKTTPKGD